MTNLIQENGFRMLSSANGVVQGVEPLTVKLLSLSRMACEI